MPYLPKSDLAELTAEEIDSKAKELNDSKSFRFAEEVNTSQLRNVFSHITKVRTDFRVAKQKERLSQDVLPAEIERNLILLKPKIAYARGRHKKLQKFQEFMFEAIDSVVKSRNKVKALENFFALMEATVAYHKFYGGKEN